MAILHVIASKLSVLADRDRNFGIAVGRALGASWMLFLVTIVTVAVTLLVMDRQYLKERYNLVFRHYVEQTVAAANARTLEATANALSIHGAAPSQSSSVGREAVDPDKPAAVTTIALRRWDKVGSALLPALEQDPIHVDATADGAHITAGPFDPEACVRTLAHFSPAFSSLVAISASKAIPADGEWAVPAMMAPPAMSAACAADINYIHAAVDAR